MGDEFEAFPRGPEVDVGSGDESPRANEFNLRSSVMRVKRSGAVGLCQHYSTLRGFVFPSPELETDID